MKSLSQQAGKISVKELCILSLWGGLMMAMQVALSFIPNVHITALLIILAAVFYGWKSLYAVAVFIMLEGLVWGFGMWWMCYWYLWPILAIPAILLRSNRSSILWAMIAALHGITFGAFCSIPYLFIGGIEMATTMWISGIPFDIAHCAGNFVLTLLLFKPLYKTIDLAMKKIRP